jgi:hypothetical protein
MTSVCETISDISSTTIKFHEVFARDEATTDKLFVVSNFELISETIFRRVAIASIESTRQISNTHHYL